MRWDSSAKRWSESHSWNELCAVLLAAICDSLDIEIECETLYERVFLVGEHCRPCARCWNAVTLRHIHPFEVKEDRFAKAGIGLLDSLAR